MQFEYSDTHSQAIGIILKFSTFQEETRTYWELSIFIFLSNEASLGRMNILSLVLGRTALTN